MPRQALKPTDAQRRMVKSMAAVGIPHERIARKIGIRSAKTLRKHFRDDLDFGMIDADYQVGKTLYEMAVSGEEPSATIFLAKKRKLFEETASDSTAPAAVPAFIVGPEPGGDEHDQP